MIIFGIVLTIMIFFYLLIFFSFIEINIKNFNFCSDRVEKISNNFKFSIKVKLLNKIKIFKINVDKKAFKVQKMKENLCKIEDKYTSNFDITNISFLKKVRINIEEINLQILIGIEDAAINAIFVGLLGTMLSILLGAVSKNLNETFWKVVPIYNKNTLEINFNCIFNIKLTHIIYTIYLLVKKGEKNARTSNRGNYAYSNE